MFVVSVKMSKRKLFTFTASALVVLTAIISIPLFSLSRASVDADCNYTAGNAAQRIAFLSQFGWRVNEEPSEVVEIIIPEKFSQVYENYNEIQKTEGFDLTEYCGKRVKRWTYLIVNYPGYEESEVVYANLLIYEGKVIGGDICNVELDGFMHGFTPPSGITPSLSQSAEN